MEKVHRSSSKPPQPSQQLQQQSKSKDPWAKKAGERISQQQFNVNRRNTRNGYKRGIGSGGDGISDDTSSSTSTMEQATSSWTKVLPSQQKRFRNVEHITHHSSRIKRRQETQKREFKQKRSIQKHNNGDPNRHKTTSSLSHDLKTTVVASKQANLPHSTPIKHSISSTPPWAHDAKKFPPLTSSLSLSNEVSRGMREPSHPKKPLSPGASVPSISRNMMDNQVNIHAKGNNTNDTYTSSHRQYPSLSESHTMMLSRNTVKSLPSYNINQSSTLNTQRKKFPSFQRKNASFSSEKELLPQGKNSIPSSTGRKRHLSTPKMNMIIDKNGGDIGGGVHDKKNKQNQKKNVLHPRLQNSGKRSQSLFLPISKLRPVNSHHADNMLCMPENFTIGKTTGDGLLKKGKQKIRRKKILSPLKKKILKERLEQWRVSQGLRADGTLKDANKDVVQEENGDDHERNEKKDLSTIVVLAGYTHSDELEDEEEYNEILGDLLSLARKITTVNVEVYIHRPSAPTNLNLLDSSEETCLAFVKFCVVEHAMAASACWNGMLLGGERLIVTTISHSLWEGYKSQHHKFGNEQEILWTDVVQQIPHFELMKEILQAEKGVSDISNCKNYKVESQYQSYENKKNDNCLVVLSNILSDDDFDDNECMIETIRDLTNILTTYGPLRIEHALEVNHSSRELYVTYRHPSDAQNAVRTMQGKVLGGIPIQATLGDSVSHTSHSEEVHVVCLENIVTEDDFEDEECLQAAREDITSLAEKCGRLVRPIHIRGGEDIFQGDINSAPMRVCVYLSYENEIASQRALDQFSGMVIGGMTVRASLVTQQLDHNDHSSDTCCSANAPSTLVLQNILTEDDYGDNESLEESKSDLMKLLQKYGKVQSMDIILNGCDKGQISITFADGDSQAAAYKACNDLNGSILGGISICARVMSKNQSLVNTDAAISYDIKQDGTHQASGNHMESVNAVSAPVLSKESHEPMYSGNKIIPEQYAECKRA